jgi:probable HAF family extracellular repeat protein
MKTGLLAFFLFAVITSSLMAQVKYSVTDLGQVSERTSNSAAFGINDNGAVTLAMPTTDPYVQAHKWDKYEGLQSLSTQLPSNVNSVGRAINFSGTVAGWTSEVYGTDRAVLMKDGEILTLPLSATTSRALAINDSSHVVGTFTAAKSTFGFLYDPATGITVLGTLPTTVASSATAINRYQDVVGYSTALADAFPHKAFIWSRQGGIRALLPKVTGSTVAYGINSTGNVVGYAMNKSSWRAFVTNVGTGRTTYYELPALSQKATKYAVAYAINEADQVVGESNTRAFLIEKGSIYDLNALIPANSGWTLSIAYSINISGQIVGTGVLNGKGHAFLLTPVK